MVYNNFKKDLEMGEKAQNEAIEKIKKEFQGIEILESKAIIKEFDIKGKHKNREITFEIKWDIMSEETENVAIEYECRGKISGIDVTEADYWIYKIKNDFYLIETIKIKQAIQNKIYFKKVIGGDAGSFTRLYLIKVLKFIELCKKI